MTERARRPSAAYAASGPRTEETGQIVEFEGLDDAQADAAADATDPGPRLAQTLAEQAERSRTRRRRIVGAVTLVIGLGVAGAAAAGVAKTNHDKTAAKPPASTTTTLNPLRPGAKKGPSTGLTLTAQPRWPSEVAGRPHAFGGLNAIPQTANTVGLVDGFYVWESFDGWHVWEVGGRSTDNFTITLDDQIGKITPVGGPVPIQQGSNFFTFSRGGLRAHVVGIDFNPGMYLKTVVITVSGGLQLHVGSHGLVRPNIYGLQRSVLTR